MYEYTYLSMYISTFAPCTVVLITAFLIKINFSVRPLVKYSALSGELHTCTTFCDDTGKNCFQDLSEVPQSVTRP